MNPHESNEQHNRIITDRHIRQITDDLRQAITRAEEDLAYAERELARLRDELEAIEYLYRLSGLRWEPDDSVTHSTALPYFVNSPGYSENDSDDDDDDRHPVAAGD